MCNYDNVYRIIRQGLLPSNISAMIDLIFYRTVEELKFFNGNELIWLFKCCFSRSLEF